MVVTHVLIDCQGDSCIVTHADDFQCLLVTGSQRFLSKDASNSLTVGDDVPDDVSLMIRRNRDIDDLDCGILYHLVVTFVSFQTVTLGDLGSMGRGARRDRDRIKTSLPVSDQVAIRHDETGTNTTDRRIGLCRQWWQVVQFK